MECQHHFDRAYLYTHHVHCHVLGSGLTDNYPLVSLLLLSTSMEAAQWSNTNTKFRKSRLK